MTETPPVKANKSRKLALMLACEFCDNKNGLDVLDIASEFLAFLEPDQYSTKPPAQTCSIPSRY